MYYEQCINKKHNTHSEILNFIQQTKNSNETKIKYLYMTTLINRNQKHSSQV